ncbi:CCHC-type domain-containing protein [Trichonephila clavipes]|nr:CCHC-type domain-containing protein [Trichonephila clavipes]
MLRVLLLSTAGRKKANQKLKVMVLYVLWKVFQKEVWIADRGASAHMTKHKNYFVDFTQFNSPQPVYVGNSDAIMTYGHGTLNIEIRINSKWERHQLTEVWYVPDISRNLISISQEGFQVPSIKR